MKRALALCADQTDKRALSAMVGARLRQSPAPKPPMLPRTDNGSRRDCFRHDFVGGYRSFSRGECSADTPSLRVRRQSRRTSERLRQEKCHELI